MATLALSGMRSRSWRSWRDPATHRSISTDTDSPCSVCGPREITGSGEALRKSSTGSTTRNHAPPSIQRGRAPRRLQRNGTSSARHVDTRCDRKLQLWRMSGHLAAPGIVALCVWPRSAPRAQGAPYRTFCNERGPWRWIEARKVRIFDSPLMRRLHTRGSTLPAGRVGVRAAGGTADPAQVPLP